MFDLFYNREFCTTKAIIYIINTFPKNSLIVRFLKSTA